MTNIFTTTPSTLTKPIALQPPVMLVTGSAKRIGAAIIESAHAAGYRVIIHAHHNQDSAYVLADRLNDQRVNSAQVIIKDLAVVNEPVALKHFARMIINCFGRLDVLVHNASRFYPTPFGNIIDTQWDELFLTNAKAPLLLSQALLPTLQDSQGCIISLLDIHADDKPFERYTVYNMAKAAHKMMVQSLALELAPHVRVNGIAPGVNVLPEGDQALDAAEQQRIIQSIPMQRIGTPNDIAQAALYLAQANYVTGHIIHIDGGRGLTLAGYH